MSPLDSPRCLSAPARGSVLVLAPHPDDEIIGVGGTLALHARQGDRVHVVVAFDGAAGLPTMDPGQARDLRCREALAGGRALSSVTSALTHQFLEFPEGHEPTDAELQAAKNKIASGATLKGELPMGRLSDVGFEWVYRGQYVPLAESIEAILSVTREEVADLARACDLTATTVLALGPLESL